MYQHYRDIPRIGDSVPTLARLHLQELHRRAAEERLARGVARARKTTPPRLPMLVQRFWRALWIGIRKESGRTSIVLPIDQQAREA